MTLCVAGEMPLKVLRALPDIYDAALKPELWKKALDNLVQILQTRSVIIMAYDLADQPFNMQAWSSLYTLDEIREYTEKFSQYEQEISDYLNNCPPRFMGKDVDIWPNIENERDRPDLKFLRERFGIVARGGARLNTHGAWKDFITVQLGREWKEVPDEFWKMLELTVPHLSKAVEIGRTFSVLRLRYQAVLAALDKVGIGMCIATGNGWIAVSNEEARRILSDRDGLSFSREGYLMARSEDVTARLKAAIHATAQTASGEGIDDEISMTCPRISGKTPFLIVVSPLRDSNSELEPHFSGSLICIIDPDETAEFSIDGLARIFGLSVAETGVCEALIHGGTVKVIADQRGVSPETVRSQVRSIYSKTNVSSRTGLIRLALLVNPPIR
jgi:DNA-binding CsgD family transcriptional regulator